MIGRASPGPGPWLLAAALGAAAVAGGDPGLPAPSRAQPQDGRPGRSDTLLVAVLTGRDTATVFADGAARLIEPASGRTVARAGPYRAFRFLTAGGGATAWGPWGELEASARRLRVVPEAEGARVIIEGRPYRGQAEVVYGPDSTLVVASRVDREAYLASVVSSELGDEGLAAFEAAKAQAVAARTYAVAFTDRGARDSLGADLVADPAVDQSYPGVLAERRTGWRAVRATRGRVLTWEGRPALAYYHSTCGGRTARPEEIWSHEPRPYLTSVEDAPAAGPEAEDFCAASPRHRWRRSWTPAQVRGAIGTAAARAAGIEPGAVGGVRGVSVTARSEHGRVTELSVVLETRPPGGGGDGSRRSAGAGDGRAGGAGSGALDTLRFATRKIPGVLRAPGGEPLPSTWFEIVERPGGGAGSLAVEGRGSGHGVGMCQWGAVERARRGAGWREILATYYPGTEIRRLEELE